MAFMPLLFIASEFYESGSFITAFVKTFKDFLWPITAIIGKSFNFSPYRMVLTNIIGIGWTV